MAVSPWRRLNIVANLVGRRPEHGETIEAVDRHRATAINDSDRSKTEDSR
jgi:hypothetical protein